MMTLDLILADKKEFPFINSAFQVIRLTQRPLCFQAKSKGMILQKYLTEPEFAQSFIGFDAGKMVRHMIKNILDVLELRNYELHGLTRSNEGQFKSDDIYELQISLDQVANSRDTYLVSANVVNTDSNGLMLFQGYLLKSFKPTFSVHSKQGDSYSMNRNSLFAEFNHEIMDCSSRINSLSKIQSEAYVEKIIREILEHQGMQGGFFDCETYDFECDQIMPLDMCSIQSSIQTRKVQQEEEKAIFQYHIVIRSQSNTGKKFLPIFTNGFVKYNQYFD